MFEYTSLTGKDIKQFFSSMSPGDIFAEKEEWMCLFVGCEEKEAGIKISFYSIPWKDSSYTKRKTILEQSVMHWLYQYKMNYHLARI